MPCTGSCAAASMKPPRTQAIDTASLKKIARGLTVLIRCPCRLSALKTATCDSTGMLSASSVERRYPDRPSNVRRTLPSFKRRFSAAIGSAAGRVR